MGALQVWGVGNQLWATLLAPAQGERGPTSSSVPLTPSLLSRNCRFSLGCFCTACKLSRWGGAEWAPCGHVGVWVVHVHSCKAACIWDGAVTALGRCLGEGGADGKVVGGFMEKVWPEDCCADVSSTCMQSGHLSAGA